MRVLLDECLPERLRDELPGHQVRTAREAGLAGKKNGLLMELASAQFDILVTVDRGIPSQQNMTKSRLGVVLIHSRNSLPALAVLLPQLREAIVGHSTMGMTQRYAHLSDDPVRATADRISSAIAAAMGTSEPSNLMTKSLPLR